VRYEAGEQRHEQPDHPKAKKVVSIATHEGECQQQRKGASQNDFPKDSDVALAHGVRQFPRPKRRQGDNGQVKRQATHPNQKQSQRDADEGAR
jgi:hypothetical protein